MKKQIQVRLYALILGGAIFIFLGFLLGQALSPINLAFREANNYVVNQDISEKEKALVIMEEQKKYIELAILTVRIEETRKMICMSIADKMILHEMWHEALKYITIAKDLIPGDLFVNYKLGLVYYSIGALEQSPSKRSESFAEAEKYLKTALQIKPDYADALYLMGRIMYDRKIYNEALGYFDKVRDLYPLDINNLFAIARVYFDVGEFEKAQKIYMKLESLVPQKSGKMLIIEQNLNIINKAMGKDNTP